MRRGIGPEAGRCQRIEAIVWSRSPHSISSAHSNLAGKEPADRGAEKSAKERPASRSAMICPRQAGRTETRRHGPRSENRRTSEKDRADSSASKANASDQSASMRGERDVALTAEAVRARGPEGDAEAKSCARASGCASTGFEGAASARQRGANLLVDAESALRQLSALLKVVSEVHRESAQR